MKTIDKHIAKLAKYGIETPEDIKQYISTHPFVGDDESIMSYTINEEKKTMYIAYASGNGETIWKWIHEAAKAHGCKEVFCLSKRGKALERKWGFKPVSALLKLEVR